MYVNNLETDYKAKNKNNSLYTNRFGNFFLTPFCFVFKNRHIECRFGILLIYKYNKT